MIRRHGDIAMLRFSASLLLPFLLISCLLFCSCGKKAEPTLKPWEKPDAPKALRAIHRESEIILFWDFPKKKERTIKGFYLMKIIPYTPPLEKGDRGDFERIAFLENNMRSYRDSNFEIGSLFRYKIISQNFKDVMSDDSNIIEVKPEQVPSPPVNLLFKIEYNALTLKWEDAGVGILYNIYKSYSKSAYPLMPENKEPIKGTTFKDSFDIKKTVYYTIRSLRGGEIWDEGPPSEELDINPSEFVPSAPEGLQAAVTEKEVYLIWKEVPETWVVGYRVYREIDKKEGFILIGETHTPSFLDTERPLIKRNYRVTALGPSKEGPASEIRDVVFIPYR